MDSLALKASLVYCRRLCLFWQSQEHPLIVPLCSYASCLLHGVLHMCMEHDCDGNDHHISLLDLLVFPLNTRSCKAKGIALRKGGLLIAGSPDKCETPRGARNCEVEHAWPTQVGSCFSARPCQWPPSPPRWIGRCCWNLERRLCASS